MIDRLRKPQIVTAHGINIKPSEFLSTLVPVPSYEEQERIADLLAVASKQLKCFKEQLSRLQEEKKALMQQLLTGKRRIKITQKEDK